MLDIALHHIKKKYYEEVVLEDVHFDIHTGEKIGLIGNNGAGKTTLFRIITGEEDATDGLVQVRKGVSIGYLPQIPVQFYKMCVDEVLKLPFENLYLIEKQMRTIELQMEAGIVSDRLLGEYSRLQHEFEVKGGYEIELNLAQITEAFKLHDLLVQEYESLSGGEKTRVSIAKLLLEAPDVLLLDEPTNHLDTEMLEWLEEFINRYKGAVVIISHDRYFMDQTIDKVVEINFGKADIYHGNYSLFTIEKEAKLALELKAYKEQQRKIKNIEETIKRFRAWAQKSDNEKFYAKAKQFEKRLEEMEKLDRPDANLHRFDFDIKAVKKSSKRMIIADKIGKSFGEKKLFEALEFEVFRGEKVCLIGGNGTGKSTIMRSLIGQVSMDSGLLKASDEAKVGYLEQEVSFTNESESILEYVKQAALLTQAQTRNMLAHYGFKGEEVFRSVGSLSGGEKSRLMLMLFTLESYNLMLLDEPTNHLDIQSKEKLESTLGDFGGTLFFISHDRYFINMIADRILWLKDGTVYSVEGNYDDFVNQRHKYVQQAIDKEKAPTKPVQSNSTVKTEEKPKKINEFKINALEGEIAKLEEKIEAATSDLTTYATDYVKLNEIQSEIDMLQSALHDKMELWLTYQ
ncbi:MULTISPECIES: ribosomal protection-like ABC-F family protein [unclassified Fusibacter]|uniref:ribosomal protection-like ABC-F family protein n=1 Tax=unclassified Fusibacter TaxID=2624464 RepID=UPI0010131ADC|nr:MULTISPECIES: ABC-F family ATP-binding cassette domain-containing protein [unclassified Fusibacter]MCK8060715.1 ABC-F family ATP-binding cassette domain-containing protein [Fusibacter sp. A2]NPE22831.1 ABC-F family ATP-binding cassette domain-containing protein [Fusibacter sp. A1]RXV59900.1 ABC transporter ATP-binding protein [Fusibacter sp. A1]